ncbi:hypothetical protein P692DRAFT_20831577 [Suillus brevipes Sb2]|nr:hypothetical protein P692DRAFT_20831577 [Suillus brevipes Sb2]
MPIEPLSQEPAGVGQMHLANYSPLLRRTRFFVVMLTWDWVKSHAIPTLVTSIFVGRSRKCWVG